MGMRARSGRKEGDDLTLQPPRKEELPLRKEVRELSSKGILTRDRA